MVQGRGSKTGRGKDYEILAFLMGKVKRRHRKRKNNNIGLNTRREGILKKERERGTAQGKWGWGNGKNDEAKLGLGREGKITGRKLS